MRAIEGRLPVAVGNARRRWATREALLVELDDGEGHVGQGEAAPLPGYSADTFERARAALRAVPWERLEVRDEAPIAAELPRVTAHVEAAQRAARCALETALLDLFAQQRACPVHRLLGARAPRPIALAALFPLDELHDPERALAFAEAQAQAGITTFKVKIGADLDRELAALLRFRREGGAAYGLRLDANRSLPAVDPSRTLARLAELAPAYVEEPFAADALLRLKAPLPVPVALDESLIDASGERLAERALDAGLVSALVLKPMALGGPLRCLRLADIAARRGAPSVVSHLFDGPIALAAAAELALALERPAAAGLAPHPGLAHWPEAHAPAFRGGRIEPHDAPGLGLASLASRP